MSPRIWRHRINDIIEAINKIKRYSKGLDFDSFQKDSKTLDAVIRNFIIIGEAARNIPDAPLNATPGRLPTPVT
jgi:uncharacterized protein with HEPN domain